MDLITLKSGDTPTLRTLLVDSTGSAVDITTYAKVTIKIAARLSVSDSEALYYKEILTGNFSHPTLGKHDEIPTEDITKLWPPKEYVFQVRWIDGSNVVTSMNVGKCIILENLIDDE